MKPARFLADLRSCPDSQVLIKHNPDTLRYRMAALAGKSRVKAKSKIIGWNDFSAGGVFTKIEIITWTEPLNFNSFGLYVGFRLFYTVELLCTQIILFCYYDGSESSPGFKTEKSAREYMRKYHQEYKEVTNEL